MNDTVKAWARTCYGGRHPCYAVHTHGCRLDFLRIPRILRVHESNMWNSMRVAQTGNHEAQTFWRCRKAAWISLLLVFIDAPSPSSAPGSPLHVQFRSTASASSLTWCRSACDTRAMQHAPEHTSGSETLSTSSTPGWWHSGCAGQGRSVACQRLAPRRSSCRSLG